MPLQFGIVLPLWSYAQDEGALLDRAAGEIALDFITVPVVTGPAVHLRFGAEPTQPVLHTGGGWHYPPDAGAYRSSGLKPQKARWFGQADVLARLARHAERLMVAWHAHVDLSGLTGLTESAPHTARRNAWGQDLTFTGPCLVNPNVRELVGETLADLRRYGVAGFELAGGLIDGRIEGLPTSAVKRRWLEKCFCPACRQVAIAAHGDGEAAGRYLREQAARALNPEEDVRATSNDDAILQHYVEVRRADHACWLARLRREQPEQTLALAVVPEEQPAAVQHALPHRVLLEEPDETALARVARQAEGVCVLAGPPACGAAAALVHFAHAARQGGLQRITFSGLDAGGPGIVTWVKQAVRFARRG